MGIIIIHHYDALTLYDLLNDYREADYMWNDPDVSLRLMIRSFGFIPVTVTVSLMENSAGTATARNVTTT